MQDTVPSVTTPVATPTTPVLAPTQSVVTVEKKNPFMALMGIIVVIIVAAGGYLLFNLITTPAQVKQQVSMTHTVFKDYRTSTNKLIDDFLDDSSDQSSPEAMERAIQKSKDILRSAEKERETLLERVGELSVAAGSEYKSKVQEYLDGSAQLLTDQKTGVELFTKYVDPLKKYSEVSVQAAGISQYMYSDPAKYITELDKLVTEEQNILDTFKGITASAPYREIHEGFILNLQAELALLQDMKSAVTKRDVNSVAKATQSYAQKIQDNSKAMEKAQDDVETTVENARDDLKDISDRVDELYSNLQRKYSF